MAVGGSGLPAITVCIKDGALVEGSANQLVYAEAVEEDVVNAAVRIRNGETVNMLKQGFNVMHLRFIIENDLHPGQRWRDDKIKKDQAAAERRSKKNRKANAEADD